MSGIDWHTLFSLSVPPLELIIRGSALYWFLFVIFRAILRRENGVETPTEVKRAVLENDGSISVVKFKS